MQSEKIMPEIKSYVPDVLMTKHEQQAVESRFIRAVSMPCPSECHISIQVPQLLHNNDSSHDSLRLGSQVQHVLASMFYEY